MVTSIKYKINNSKIGQLVSDLEKSQQSSDPGSLRIDKEDDMWIIYHKEDIVKILYLHSIQKKIELKHLGDLQVLLKQCNDKREMEEITTIGQLLYRDGTIEGAPSFTVEYINQILKTQHPDTANIESDSSETHSQKTDSNSGKGGPLSRFRRLFRRGKKTLKKVEAATNKPSTRQVGTDTDSLVTADKEEVHKHTRTHSLSTRTAPAPTDASTTTSRDASTTTSADASTTTSRDASTTTSRDASTTTSADASTTTSADASTTTPAPTASSAPAPTASSAPQPQEQTHPNPQPHQHPQPQVQPHLYLQTQVQAHP